MKNFNIGMLAVGMAVSYGVMAEPAQNSSSSPSSRDSTMSQSPSSSSSSTTSPNSTMSQSPSGSMMSPNSRDPMMSKETSNATEAQITAQYKTDREVCNSMSGNTKDICVAEAKGREKVAKAELDAQKKNTDKARQEVLVTKAEAEYDIAKERCDDRSGNDKDVCRKDAKAALQTAKADAKRSTTANKSSSNSDSSTMSSSGTASMGSNMGSSAAGTSPSTSGSVNNSNVDASAANQSNTTSNTTRDQAAIDAPLKSQEKDMNARQDPVAGDKTGDSFASAKERCDSLSGSAKDQCVSDAKSRFGAL